jgi:aminomethyltransferase
MTESLERTPLHDLHVAAGAKMVPFAGFEMPVQYAGVVAEHQAVRTGVGLFDVSHMGEVEFTGAKADEVVSSIVSNDVSGLANGQACYTVMCNDQGGIIDDLVVYKFSPDRVLICVNAANRYKDFAWMKQQANERCEVTDRGDAYAQIAVQGPKAAELVKRISDPDPSDVGTYRFITGTAGGVDAIIARTGYTGEDGFELYVPSGGATKVWNALVQSGADLGVQPAGLGARDSLRLEMCFPLYGNDIDDGTHPFEAGLGWVVKLDKPVPFTGQDALRRIKAEGNTRRLVPLVMKDRGIARQGYPVVVDGREGGVVTSGTKSPSTGEAIALAYVPTSHAKVGSRVAVAVRGREIAAEVVKRPFLKR